MNNLLTKPYLWIAFGVAIGAVGALSATQRAGFASAAGPQTQPVVARPVTALNPNAINNLKALDEAFTSLVEFIEPAVVHIRAENTRNADEQGRFLGGPVGGQGSGVIFRPDGWIITNDHVVAGFNKVTVILADGRELSGKVTRSNDPQNDIAVVKVDAKDLPTVKFANSDNVRPGQHAVAVGSPFGLENTVTIGHISGLGRTNAVMSRTYSDMIQTDAPINPGNSGGPLLNIAGEVVGINTAIFSGSGGNVGIGFAIPSNQAMFVAELLMKNGKLTRGYLGLAPDNLKPIEKQKLKVQGGAIVRDVPTDGPAAAAGIKEGDVITKINGLSIDGQLDLRNAMLAAAPGSSARVEYVRDGQTRSANIKVGKLPDRMASVDRAPSNPQNPDDFFEEFRRRFEGPDAAPREQPAPQTPSDGKARLGVRVVEIDDAARAKYSVPKDVEGAIVEIVDSGSVAEKAGLKPGDVIRSLGDRPIRNPQDLVDAMKSVKVGDTKSISFNRYAKGSMMNMTFDVTF